MDRKDKKMSKQNAKKIEKMVYAIFGANGAVSLRGVTAYHKLTDNPPPQAAENQGDNFCPVFISGHLGRT